MRKIFFILSIGFIYLNARAQKASFYTDKSVNLNAYSSFYLVNSPMDAHDLTSPYFKKGELNDTTYLYFATYYELSLKNLLVIDSEHNSGGLLAKPYMAMKFDEVASPLSYKPAKLKGMTLIVDLLDATTQTLVWRGWISMARIKAKTDRDKLNIGMHLIYKLLQLEGSEMPG